MNRIKPDEKRKSGFILFILSKFFLLFLVSCVQEGKEYPAVAVQPAAAFVYIKQLSNNVPLSLNLHLRKNMSVYCCPRWII